ncbi:SDR family oxidoreductase [Solirubrobacter soli]|uniref:SDR family oxidoreductase n=1 Tax=Solirubrobacter soli TaxID=363832 RepID=UPI00041E4D61|nr:SDR family oxidoreductase [Solirubrobacter soli]
MSGSDRHALVVGVTGISGNNVARRLAGNGWRVTGVSRRAAEVPEGVAHVAADITDAEATRAALADTRPTHLFFCTWSRQADEAGNIRVNGAMLRNVLEAVGGSLQHAALVTGLKHYLGPFEAYAQTKPDTPFVEEQPRLPYENFYYEQEDILFEAAEREGFTWSVHRPHTMIGWALGNAMNMGVTLAVYGSICKQTGRPFVFPGTPEQYEGVTDITDARLLAAQLEWAATTPAAADEAFNIVNGDVFRWKRMWRVVAEGLGLEAAPYPGAPTPLEEQMRDAGPLWETMVERYGLRSYRVEQLASWWHTDADLGRTLETFTSMGKSRRFGFLSYQDSAASFLDVFDALRRERIIPSA